MINNLRILYDNALDRANLSSANALTSLPASNLTSDRKGLVWRADGLTDELTLTWPSSERVSMVALAFSNFSTAATMRVRGYTNAADVDPLFDTGALSCCRWSPVLTDWGGPTTGVNAFAYGGGSYAVLYFGEASVKKLVIDLDDSSANASGYLEAARLICGSYWSPTFNADYGAKVGYADNSKSSRSDAGELVTVRGSRCKEVGFSMSKMLEADRDKMTQVLRWCGSYRPLFCSVFPEDANPKREDAYQIYGKQPSLNPILHDYYANYTSQVDIQEI